MTTVITGKRTGSRQMKRWCEILLKGEDYRYAQEEIGRLPFKRVVSPLIGLFCHREKIVRWRAVSAVGSVVSAMAKGDMPAARIVMRRLMWSLNEESGGIGWGAPEAMGDICARHGRLSVEFHRILISYIMPGGNYLEHEPLQQGVLWGLARLAGERPEHVKPSAFLLTPFLGSDDDVLRGLAAWTAGMLGCPEHADILQQLTGDHAEIEIYLNGYLKKITIGNLVDVSSNESSV